MAVKVHPDLKGSGETMTVGELRAFLLRYPQDTPFLATWERVLAGFREENFRLTDQYGREEVWVDVEDYG